LFAAGVVACGSSYDPAQDGGLATGGKTGNTGGSSTGGSSTGGSSTGGSSTGGAATGGSSTGGSSTGGSSTGGSSSGGSSTGGSSTGGSATGGKGGSGTGGGSTGGKGGSSTGGSSGGGAAGCGTQTYANTYMAFFQMYCISCHTTAGRPNFSTQSGIKNASSQIKTDAVTGTKMPEGTGPKPTSDQRKALGAWLDCGAP
jgi:hypothetical protein